jgi:hypothetical protein
VSSPTSNVTTSFDHLFFSVINSNSCTNLHKYHLDFQHGVWIQSRDLFEEKFNETFLHMVGIVCLNDSFSFQFSAITSFNITLNWWNGGPKVIDRTIHFQIIRKPLINRSNSSSIVLKPMDDSAIILNINSEKGDIFWQSICKRFNLQFLGLSKLHTENYFGFATEYFISECYQAGRSVYFIPRGSYLLVKTKLFSHIKFIPIRLNRVTDLKSVDCWSIGKDLYRETIIKFFEFYSSFDKSLLVLRK